MKIIQNIQGYFQQGKTITDFIFDSMGDHIQSMALLNGMWGNVWAASYYNQLSKILTQWKNMMDGKKPKTSV